MVGDITRIAGTVAVMAFWLLVPAAAPEATDRISQEQQKRVLSCLALMAWAMSLVAVLSALWGL